LGFLACSSFSKADEVCPSGTVGLCDPAVIETIVESIDITTQNDGAGTLTTTVTTTTTTTDTVVNTDSGDLLASGSDYVASSKEGDMDIDWGGQGSASMPTGSGCGALGTDKCAQITGSGNNTSAMGVSGMGTTFIQTIDISDLNVSSGGKTTYTIKVDKQDASDSIYMHITGKDGNTTSFAGTDVLSATGITSGYQEYTGSFNFANALTSIIVEVGGRDINLAIGPLFDDVSINVLYNVISQIILQTITTVEQYVYINGDATQEELDIVEDIFEHNDTIEQPDGNYDLEPIDSGGEVETSYEMVEMELELEMDFDIPDINVEFDIPDINMEPPVTAADVEMEMEMDMLPPPNMPAPPEPEIEPVIPNAEESKPEVEAPVEKIVVASTETEPEPETTTEPETKEEVKEEVKDEVKEEPKEELKEEVKEEPKEEVKEEVKEEPKEEVKEEPKKEVQVVKKKVVKPKTKAEKKEEKQKAGTKIVKKMGDKGRYDNSNQLKTLIIMNVISDAKSFFNAQTMLQDTPGFFSSATVPDALLSDNNVAAYLMMVGSSQKMNSLINSQYE